MLQVCTGIRCSQMHVNVNTGQSSPRSLKGTVRWSRVEEEKMRRQKKLSVSVCLGIYAVMSSNISIHAAWSDGELDDVT